MWCQIISLAVLALCLHQGEAIKCYTCSSATDSKCGDPIDSSMGQTECTPQVYKDAANFLKGAAEAASGLLGKIGIDANVPTPDTNAAFVCAKAVAQVNDKKVVTRSCSVAKVDQFDMCKQMKESGGATVTFCETCDSDGCNAASGVLPSSLLLLLAAALTAAFLKQ